MPSTYIQRTPSGGNRKKWTWSAWIKLSDVTSGNRYLWSGYSASNNTGYLSAYFHTDGQLTIGAWNTDYLNTTRVFKDPTAWYHIVIAMDTAQATAANRLKLYVNGVEETTFDTDNRSSISQDSDMGYNSNGVHTIGGYQSSGSANAGFDGIMSHVHFTDGYAYTPSAFGETDATTGEWKINTSPSVSYGTTGYWIFKDDAGITDQSPNSNNWTASGNLTKTEDCPSNVFATFNPLIKTPSGLSFSNGNTTLTTTNSQWEGCATTLAPSSGKWYWEAKYNTGSGIRLDIARLPTDLRFFENSNQSYLTYAPYGYGYQLNNSGYDYYGNNNTMTTWTTNRGNSTKIYMVAVDLDNGKWWIGADGSWFNKSGTANPVTGADPLHDFSANLNGDAWLFGMSVEGSGGSHNANFGNGYFGTTAVSSAGINASGNGIFEYDVPTGYTALSTKGLNE